MNKIPTMLNEANEDFGISKKKIIETIPETEYVIHPELTFTFIAKILDPIPFDRACKNENL
jgi:hypothetical protein